MDIKKANINLLLGKIRTYLDAQRGDEKREKDSSRPKKRWPGWKRFSPAER